MRLTDNVLLRDPQSGEVVFAAAGDEVPEWMEEFVGEHLHAQASDETADKPKTRKPRAKVSRGQVSVDDN